MHPSPIPEEPTRTVPASLPVSEAEKAHSREHTAYLRQSAIAIFVLLLLVTACNVTIDPYLRFGTPRIEGWSQRKPKAIRQVRMAKAYGVMRGDYRTIFLGNSRVDIGLNPQSEQLSANLLPAYNLGQPGSGSELARQYLEHVLADQTPNTVVLGVDFLNYLRKPADLGAQEVSEVATESVSADAARLNSMGRSTRSWPQFRQQVKDTLAATVSLSAVGDSLLTILAQNDPNAANISDQGFNSGSAFRNLIQSEGQASLFRQKNSEYIDKCLERVAPVDGQSAELQAIEAALQLCQRRGIRVEVYIHPYHADVLEIFDATGHWGNFERWKMLLNRICEAQGSSLWDFANYSSRTTESPPAEGDRRTIMRWYWESGHYREALGEQVLVEILGQELPATPAGYQLTPSTLESQLAATRVAAVRYRLELKEQSHRVRRIVTTRKSSATPR